MLTSLAFLGSIEYADGSILFNFGTSEQETAGKTSQDIFKVPNGPCSSGKEGEDSATQPAQFNGLSKDPLEKRKASSQAELKETSVENSDDVDGIPDPATLICITYDAENVSQELNKNDDKKNLLNSGSSNGELLSKGIEKVCLKAHQNISLYNLYRMWRIVKYEVGAFFCIQTRIFKFLSLLS